MSNVAPFQSKFGSATGMGQGMGSNTFGPPNNAMVNNATGNAMGGGLGMNHTGMNAFGNQPSPVIGQQHAAVGTSQYNPQNRAKIKDTHTHGGKKIQIDAFIQHICGPNSAYATKSQEELRWEDIQMKSGKTPPQYGSIQQSGGFGGGVMGLGNMSKPGGFSSVGFGQQSTNQSSPFGAAGNTGFNSQQSTTTTAFGGGFGSSNAGGLAGAPQSGAFGANGFGMNTQTNNQASPFGGASNTGFGASTGLGQTQGLGQTGGAAGAFGGFGANNSAKPMGSFGSFGATNTQTPTPNFSVGAGFGTGAAGGTPSSFGTTPFGAAGTPGTTGAFGASTTSGAFGTTTMPGATGSFGATAPTGAFGNVQSAAPATGGFGQGATASIGLGAPKAPSFGGPGIGTPSFSFNPGGVAPTQTAAPSTGAFGSTGSFGGLGTGTGALGATPSTLGLGGFSAGGAFGSMGNGFGGNSIQPQPQIQQQQQVNIQQQQQFVNPMISIKDKVTSLRSKAKKLSDAQSKDIPSNALVPSKFNDRQTGASLRGGLPMPMGSNARMTPRGKQATTPLSNQKTLSSSMMSNVAKAPGVFTSPDAFMGRSVRRLVIDSSSISNGNDSWVNKLLPQRVGTPSDRPETHDSPEPWKNTNKSPGGAESWSNEKYQDETYDSRSDSPERRFQPSPEAVRGNNGTVMSATKNINSIVNNSPVGEKDKYDDVEINQNAPKITNPNYKLTPSLAVLKMMTDQELSCIRNFTIELRDETDYNSLVAEIEWLEEVDLRCLDLDNIVQMSHMEVAVYEDSTYKPLEGEELNKPCKVTLYRVLPKKNQTVEQAMKKWKKAIEKDGTKILSYDEYSKYDVDGPPIGRLVFQTLKWC